MVSQARMGPVAAWMVVLAILILTAMCLISLLMSCKAEKKIIMMDDGYGHLITTNTENPGTDCTTGDLLQNFQVMYKGQQAVSQTPSSVCNKQTFKRSTYRSSTRRSYRGHFQRSSVRSSCTSNYSFNTNAPNLREILAVQINQKLLALQTRDEEDGIYKPHCYTDEGQPMASDELDAISIPEDDFHPEMLKNLDSRFSQLAAISRPDLMKK